MTQRRLQVMSLAYLGHLGAALLVLLPIAAPGQTYPDRSIRIVIPAPPGGGMDAIGRALSDPLALALKQPVVIENRPGGNGVIATQLVARAAPDGYTLLLMASFHAINVSTVRKLPYDSVKDFAGIAKLGDSPAVLVSSAQSGVRTVADFSSFVARNRDAVTFAVSSMETRLGAESVLQRVGAKGVIVNYKGTGPAVSDLAGGHVPFFVTTIASVLGFKDSGKVNLIGVAAKTRNPYIPDVPTLAEQGLDAQADVWYGLVAPAGTPREVVLRLNREIARINALPGYQARLRTLSIQSASLSPAEFDAFIKAEVGRFETLVKAARIEPE